MPTLRQLLEAASGGVEQSIAQTISRIAAAANQVQAGLGTGQTAAPPNVPRYTPAPVPTPGPFAPVPMTTPTPTPSPTQQAMFADEIRRKQQLMAQMQQQAEARRQQIATGDIGRYAGYPSPMALSPREQLMYETLNPAGGSMAYAPTAEMPPPTMPALRQQAVIEQAKGGTFRPRSPLTEIPGWERLPSTVRNPAEMLINAQNLPLVAIPAIGGTATTQAKILAQMAAGQLAGGIVGERVGGERGEQIGGTVGMIAGPFAPAGYRKAAVLTEAVGQRYPVLHEAAVGGEAGGLKLPFGKKAAEPVAEVAEAVEPKVLAPEEKMAGMIEGATKAKPEYAAKLTAKRKAAAGAIASIREQERAGATTREEASRNVAAARKGVIEAKYEFPEELVPTPDEVVQLRGKITAADLKPHDYENTHIAFNTLMAGGHLQPHEITYLEKVFGPEVGEAIRTMQADPLLSRLWREAIDAANIPRTIFTSYDISFPMRQGGAMIGEEAWWKAWKPMIKSLREKDAVAYYDEMMTDPFWESLGMTPKELGLAIAEPTGKGGIAATQEGYVFRDTLVARITRRIPGVAPSQQAYSTAGNKLRWDTFKKYITGWDKAGLKYTPEDAKRLATAINIFSGWGKIGKLEKILPELSQGIFSPRFWASRLEMIPYGIYAAVRSPRLMGPMVARNLGTFIAGNMALAGLAKVSGVADVEIDPRSTDWGRMRFGPLRLDFTAGQGKVLRFFVQLAGNQAKSASSGEFYPLNRMKTALREIQGHLSPQGGLVADILTGTTFIGEPMQLTGESLKAQFWNRMAPGFIQDTVDAIRAFGPIGALAAIPAATGVTTLTYATPWEKMAAAKNAAAKSRFGVDFKTLAEDKGTPKANELIADDPGIAAAQEEIDKRKEWYADEKRTMADIKEPFIAEQEADDAALMAGTMTGEDWKNSYNGRQEILGAKYDEYLDANPDMAEKMVKDLAGVDPLSMPDDASPDLVRAAYFSLFDKYEGATGLITDDEWGTLSVEIEEFRAGLTATQAKALDENLMAGKSETVKEYRTDMATIKPYWDARDTGWPSYAKAQGVDVAKYPTFDSYITAKTQYAMENKVDVANLDSEPVIKGFTAALSELHQILREQTPEIDALLHYWGYNKTVRTDEAAALYHERYGVWPRVAKE